MARVKECGHHTGHWGEEGALLWEQLGAGAGKQYWGERLLKYPFLCLISLLFLPLSLSVVLIVLYTGCLHAAD